MRFLLPTISSAIVDRWNLGICEEEEKEGELELDCNELGKWLESGWLAYYYL